MTNLRTPPANDYPALLASAPGGITVLVHHPERGFVGFATLQQGGGTRGASRMVAYKSDGARKIVPLGWLQFDDVGAAAEATVKHLLSR